jgi:hypothetical protein
MNPKQALIDLVMYACVFAWGCACFAQNAEQKDKPASGSNGAFMMLEFEEQLNRIKSLGQAKDLDGLEQAGNAIEENWNKLQGDRYFRLVSALCDEIRTRDFRKPRKEADLEQRFAKLAFQKPGEMPLEVELGLVGHLQSNIEGEMKLLKGPAWTQDRREKVKRLFHAWGRLEGALEDDFDVNDPSNMPRRNVSPPEGVSNLPAGASPDQIKDAALRAEYEAAIAANARKAERYNRQYRLRQLDKVFSRNAEKLVITVYSQSPFDLEDLRQQLDAHSALKAGNTKLAERKARIVKAVTDAMASQATQPAEPPAGQGGLGTASSPAGDRG